MSSKIAADEDVNRTQPKARSLAARLAAMFAIAAFTLLLVATAFPYFALAINLDREDNDSLTEKVDVIESLLRKSPSNPADFRSDLQQEAELQVSSPVLLRVLSADGRTLAESRGMGDILPDSAFSQPTQFHVEWDRFVDTTLSDGRAFRTFSTRINPPKAVDSGWPGGPIVVQVGLDRSAEAKLLTNYRRGLLLELALGLLACAFGGYVIIQGILKRDHIHINHVANKIINDPFLHRFRLGEG